MVAKSAEEQMATSDQQAQHMDSSVNSMKELSQGVGQISESNEEMLHAADDVSHLVHKGSGCRIGCCGSNGYDSYYFQRYNDHYD